MVFKRAGDSIVMGRKGGPQGTTVWDVVFSSKTLIVGGKSFDVAQIEDLRVDESPYVHSDETRDPKILSGIHVFGPRRSVVFCKKLTREETFFVFTVLKAVFLGASPQKVLKGVSKRR
jgi:hypothetical protein